MHYRPFLSRIRVFLMLFTNLRSKVSARDWATDSSILRLNSQQSTVPHGWCKYSHYFELKLFWSWKYPAGYHFFVNFQAVQVARSARIWTLTLRSSARWHDHFCQHVWLILFNCIIFHVGLHNHSGKKVLPFCLIIIVWCSMDTGSVNARSALA